MLGRAGQKSQCEGPKVRVHLVFWKPVWLMHSELGDEKEFADPVGSGFDVGCKKEKSKMVFG